VTPKTHGGNPWALLDTQGSHPEEILDFSADLNPSGPPESVSFLLQEGCKKVPWYPEPTYRDFREAAARFHGIDPSHILPGNGTAQLIHLISRWQRKSRVAVVTPTFTEYERAVTAEGGDLVPWPLQEENRFLPPALNGALGLRGARLLFLCNPNNPTGTLWPMGELLQLIQTCEQAGTWIVVDEATMDLVEDRLRYSVVPFVKRFPHLIVLRSMTKSFSVPGLRIGYLAASKRAVEELNSIQPPWAMNALAAFVGAGLFKEERYLKDSRQRIKELKHLLWEGLSTLPGLSPYPSEANFFLCRMTDPKGSNQGLAQKLQAQGILIRTCDDFTGLARGQFIRLAVRRLEENGLLVEALRRFFSHAG